VGTNELAGLASVVERQTTADGMYDTAVPGLRLYRFSVGVSMQRLPRLAGLDRSNPVAHNAVNSRPLLGREQVAAVWGPDFDCKNAPPSNREVMMSEMADFCIDVEAVKALISWKSLFADEVAARARRLAAESSRSMSPCHTTGRLHKSPFAHSRLRFWTEGHPVTTAKPHESEQPASQDAISAVADDWIRQFINPECHEHHTLPNITLAGELICQGFLGTLGFMGAFRLSVA